MRHSHMHYVKHFINMLEGEERPASAKQMENVDGKVTFRKLSEYIFYNDQSLYE